MQDCSNWLTQCVSKMELLLSCSKPSIYASVNWVIIGSGNGLAPYRHQSNYKRYSIRSHEERALKVVKFKHDNFCKCAFAVYGPLVWNCSPKEIRLCGEIQFKRKTHLKTHLFVKFVNESTLGIWFWRIIIKRPRMLSAEFVVLYKTCEPKPVNLNSNHWRLIIFHSTHSNKSPVINESRYRNIFPENTFQFVVFKMLAI